jgi:hypothetical protein
MVAKRWARRPRAVYGSQAKPASPSQVIANPAMASLVTDARRTIRARTNKNLDQPLVFIRSHGRSDKASTLKLLDDLLSPTLLARSFIVVSHVDEHVVKGWYRERLDSSWAQRLIVGPDGANHVDFFIDMVNQVGQKYLRFDDNIKKISMYDIKNMELVDARTRKKAFAKAMIPDDSHLGGANLWGFTNAHKPVEFRDAAQRSNDQWKMSQSVGLVCGTFMGRTATHDADRFSLSEITDDCEQSCRALGADSAVSRLTFFTVDKGYRGAHFGGQKHGGISGGYNSASDHAADKKRGLQYLVDNYADWVRFPKQGDYCGSDTGLIWFKDASNYGQPLSRRPRVHRKTRSSTSTERSRASKGQPLGTKQKRGRPRLGAGVISGKERMRRSRAKRAAMRAVR